MQAAAAHLRKQVAARARGVVEQVACVQDARAETDEVTDVNGPLEVDLWPRRTSRCRKRGCSKRAVGHVADRAHEHTQPPADSGVALRNAGGGGGSLGFPLPDRNVARALVKERQDRL